jgi:hypothetical protein
MRQAPRPALQQQINETTSLNGSIGMAQVDKIVGGRGSPAQHASNTARVLPELSVV